MRQLLYFCDDEAFVVPPRLYVKTAKFGAYASKARIHLGEVQPGRRVCVLREDDIEAEDVMYSSSEDGEESSDED